MSSSNPVAEFLHSVEIFSDLEPEELDELAWLCRAFEASQNEILFRQGDPAHDLYVLEVGKVGLSVRLPGDVETTLRSLGPGECLGELALIDDNVRSAKATVLEPVRGYRIPQVAFRVMLESLRPWTAKVLRHLIRRGCAQVRWMNEQFPAEAAGPFVTSVPTAELADETERLASYLHPDKSVDIESLAAFPMLQTMTGSEVTTIASYLQPMVVPRGSLLFSEGDYPTACVLVLRGALQVCQGPDLNSRKLALLGPGHLAGYFAFLDGSPRTAHVFTRENSILLMLSREDADRIWAGHDPHAIKFLVGILGLVSITIRKANRRLTRLITEGR